MSGELHMGTAAHEGLSSPHHPPGSGSWAPHPHTLPRQRDGPGDSPSPHVQAPCFQAELAPLAPEKPPAGNHPLQLQENTGAWGPRLVACSVWHIWSVWRKPWLSFPQMVSPCSVLLPGTAQLLLFQMLVPGPPPAAGHFWNGPRICIWCI